jgi:hypothetical protein
MGKRKKKNTAPYLHEPECDENFQFIAGYTEGGVPFGITWEEAKLIEERENLKALMKNEEIKNCESPVDLAQLINAFDMQSDHLSFYVNRVSGELLSLTEIEEMEQDDESELNTSVLDSDGYVPLPSRWELNKYEIMEDFVFSLEDPKMQEILARAIRGKGAFGRFHTAVQAYKIQNQWYEYQKDRLREIAVEWCHQNRLAYK